MVEVAPQVRRSVAARIRETVRADSKGDYHALSFRAMSTPVRVAFSCPKPAVAGDYLRAAAEWVSAFEARYSRFIPESVVGQVNGAAGRGDWVEVDGEADRLLALCDEMHRLTGGAFDAASLPLLRAWDWRADPPRVPDAAALAEARRLSGWDKVERRPGAVRLPEAGMGVDLGGIGKEYAVDRLVEMAAERGIGNVMVDIGGDLRVSGHGHGKDAWYVGLEEPDRPGDCWACLRLTDRAVATSGDYLRSFTRDGRRYGHVLDPRTGEPVANGCQAVTVVAPTCVLAGVLSTAAFVLGPVEGLDLVRRYAGGVGGGGVEACVTTESARHQTRRFSDHVAM
ncbi:MAG TPA: FAD:protein FMN transferase [Humisphaera sp.]